MKIVVLGSSNVDMSASVERLPLAGETVGNARFLVAYGGKGANQAVASCRLGGDTAFISALGDDSFGAELKEYFSATGLDTSGVFSINNMSTGIALIMVGNDGENCIAVCPGANGCFTPELVDRHEASIREASLLVMQAEIPLPSIRRAAEIAHRNSTPVLFNPAPICDVDNELLGMIDILVVNEHECAAIARIDNGAPVECADMLHKRGVANVVVTLGSKGAYARTPEGSISVPAFKVEAVDAVGAGDTFCGALAANFAERGIIDNEALTFAAAAAAISVTRRGAQPSIPTLDETIGFIAKHSQNKQH